MNVRRPAMADVPEVLALCRAADAAVYGDSDWTEDDLREEWEHELDLERDAWVIELGGGIAGYGTFGDRGQGRLVADGYVHPDLRGGGVGARLLELQEARAAEIDEGRTLESATLVGDDAAEELFRGRGFVPVRHFWRMVAELDEEPRPAWPAGIAASPFDPAGAREFHAALNEAFAEEWKRNGDWGWIGALAVRPAWRRRGLGEALLRASFAEFFRRGERRVALGVDAQNPTGAPRLYERAGMRVLWEAIVYRKPL